MNETRKIVPTFVIAELAIAGLLAGLAASPALAQDSFKELAKRYDQLAKNHDDDANRERRYVLLDMFPYRTEKSCRKLLKEAFDDEKSIANRHTVVQLLSGAGDTKSLDFLISSFKKEKARAPVIALGQGLGYTPDAVRAEMTARAAKHLKKAKDDLRLALIEGIGELGDPSGVPILTDLAKMTTEEWFERNLALGRCGGEAAVPLLEADAGSPLPDVRLGTALGLAATECDSGYTALTAMLSDNDERVVRAAAHALAKAGKKEAAAPMAKALGSARTLRTREELRGALRTLLGQDYGYDAASWEALAGGDSPPKPAALPEVTKYFGLPVASDSFAVMIDTSRSTGWMERIDRMRDEVVGFIQDLPPDVSFALARAARQFAPYSDSFVSAAGRSDAIAWIDDLKPGGGFDMREALVETLARYPQADTIVVATDSHPWGSGTASGSRETMEIFRRLNRTKQVKLIIALVMPGGRYDTSERSETEIVERIDFLTEMAEDSGGLFVNVEK